MVVSTEKARTSVDFVDVDEPNHSVAVLGTGNYGLAFAGRVARNSQDGGVVLASRRGEADPNGFPPPCPVMSYEEAVATAGIVVFAVPVGAQPSIIKALGKLLDGKVIVDVSNPPPATLKERLSAIVHRGKGAAEHRSNAEHLVEELEEQGVVDATVIKAFNNVSAYALSQPPGSSNAAPKACMISGDDEDGKREVAMLARRMGFDILDLGGLDAAANQEKVVYRFFDQWREAVIIGILAAMFFLAAAILQSFVWGPKSWEELPKRALLVVTGDVSAFLLVLSFLPGPIAAIWQIVRGTARRPFPTWFGNWLLIRKQLGLLAFSVCIPHVIIACMGGAETPTIVVYQLAPFFGTLAFTLFYVVASCSNTSVSGHFTWREFQFVFVRVGYSTVVLTAGHVACILAADVLYAPLGLQMLPTVVGVLALLCLCVVMKVVVSVPPVGTAVQRIRAQQKVSLLPEWVRDSIGSRLSFSMKRDSQDDQKVGEEGTNDVSP